MWANAWSPGKTLNRSLSVLVVGLAIAGPFVTPVSNAADTKKLCDLLLDSYRELGKVAEFKITLRCDASLEVAFPVNDPLVIGLTATTSDDRESDRVEIEYDFPLQNLVVVPDTTLVTLTFHAQLADISGKTHVYAMAWPLAFLQDCAGGRSGCTRFGYALAPPASLAKICITKNESGQNETTDDIRCREFLNRRFKFR